MRLLYISNGYPPHRWAGTENYTAAIATELRRRGAHVQVLCAGGWESGRSYYNGHEDDVHEGVDVRRVNLNWTKAPDPFGYLYDNPVSAEVLDRFLDEFAPDVVHVTSCETLSASVLRVVKERAFPLVLSLTDFWFLCPRINLLRSDGENCDRPTTPGECLTCLAREHSAYRWPRVVLSESGTERLLSAVSKYPFLTRHRGLRGIVGDMEERKAFLKRALQWPDVRITASSFVRDVHVANGVDAEILVRPYGHDLSWLEASSSKTPSGLVRVGYVGQVLRSKGVHLILEAARRLPAEAVQKLGLLIYGDLDKSPDYRGELMALAEGLPHVEFKGTYRHEDSAAVYAGFDVLVVPSLWYDFPLVIHEAFATRTPVVATNLGGMAEAVTHEVDGLLFRKGDIEDLAAQLGRLVSEPGLVDRLRGGIKPVKTVQQEGDELEECYAQLVKARVPQRPRSQVSVIIPNYNHTRYLPDAIRSALAQSSPPLEVIVVDDGSTDDCREVVEGFGPDVRYIYQANQGLAGARNTGIRAARGELVGLLDADDRWLPTFVESVISLAAEHPDASVYYACAQGVDEAGRELPQVFGGPPIPPDALYQRLLRANFLIPSTVVLRREAVMSAGLFDATLRSCEDWDLWLRLLPTHQFVGSEARLVHYRVHGGSLSGNPDNMRRAAQAVIQKKFGDDDGLWSAWSADKRRAYGGLHRYFLLVSVQREGDWRAAAGHLLRALQTDPSLATDLDMFYDLALGGQPVGYRGSPGHVAIAENVDRVTSLIAGAFDGTDSATIEPLRGQVLGTALQALGLVAYNTGQYRLSRRLLLRAACHRPALWRDRLVVGDVAKSLVKGLSSGQSA